MTDTTIPDTGKEKAATQEQRKERAALGCLFVIALGAGGAIAVSIPETAYYVAGLATSVGIRKARKWMVNRRENTPETGTEDTDEVDIVACLHELSDGQHSVLLTALKDAAELPDTKTVRALLDDAGISVRKGVRTPGGNGPGVHHDDIPTPPPNHDSAPVGGCSCRSTANTNTNNTQAPIPREGFRVDRTDHGFTVHDLSETTTRHHAITK